MTGFFKKGNKFVFLFIRKGYKVFSPLRYENDMELFINTIKFIDNNISGFIFLFILWHYWLHNLIIIWRFKRERREKEKNIKIARCKEENTKDRIYFVIYNKKNKNGKGKYYHIFDNYTFTMLGYHFGDDAPKEKVFSRKNKKLGKRIKLNDLKQDIVFVISGAEKFKELLNNMKIK